MGAPVHVIEQHLPYLWFNGFGSGPTLQPIYSYDSVSGLNQIVS